MVGSCVEAVVQPRLRMDLLQDMAGSTAAAAARALDHRRQKAQNLLWLWSINVEYSRNLTWPIFSLSPSPKEFDEARPLVNYKSTNARPFLNSLSMEVGARWGSLGHIALR